MSRGKKKQKLSPEKQLIAILNKKFTPNVSKIDSNPGNIRSFGTYKAYLQQGKNFIKWCTTKHGEMGVLSMKKYITEYLMENKNEKMFSNRTIKTQRSALAKIYDVSTEKIMKNIAEKYYDGNNKRAIDDFMFRREDIRRSRDFWTPDRVDDTKAGTLENDIKIFCESCGLRRKELESLRKEHILFNDDGSISLRLPGNTKDAKTEGLSRVNTKGGKSRTVEFLKTNESIIVLQKLLNNTAKEKDLLFPNVPSRLDVHNYRAVYANRIYEKYADHIENIDPNERIPAQRKFKECCDGKSRVARDGMVSRLYRCQDDLKGIVLDRKAMRIVSKNLGHNRESIFALNYYRK